MKKKLLISIGVFIGAMVFLAVALVVFFMSPVSKKEDIILFEIKEGSASRTIINNLKNEDLIHNEFFGLVYYKLSGYVLKSGTYELKQNMSIKDIFKILDDGHSIESKGKKVTFIEGKKLKSYVTTIANNFNYTEEEIFAVLNNKEFLNNLISNNWFITDEILNSDLYYPLEGYLFPDTYKFELDASIEEIILTMIANLSNKITPYKDKIEKSKYSFHEILSLASDIELEGKLLEDRKTIAGVFYNRLNINMSLGSDVTTYYAVKVELNERDLYRNELDKINPYNTRAGNMGGKINVGPICSPSLNSIIAAVEPTNSDYLYFYADPSGGIHFSKTLIEHENIVRKYR